MTSITVKKEEPPSDFVCLEDEAADMERLKQENEALRRALAGLKKQLTVQNKSDSVEDVKESKAATAENLKSLHASLSTPEGTNEFYSQLRAAIDSPSFLAKLDTNRAILLGNADNDDEVGVVDLDDVTWWTVVPKDDEFEEIDPSSLGGSYVFVERTDVVEAIADFVAMYLVQIPATQKLSAQEFQALLSNTCEELREKGPMRRMWDWGKFLYATYGWSMTGLSLYRDPTIVLYVLRAIWTASKWAMMFAL